MAHITKRHSLTTAEMQRVQGVTTADLVRLARVWLLNKEPFFRALILQINYHIAAPGIIPGDTVKVSRRNMWMCEQWVYRQVTWGGKAHDPAQPNETGGAPKAGQHPNTAWLRTEMAREIMHVVLRHVSRRGKRERMLWSLACDFVVDMMVNGFNELSKGNNANVPFPANPARPFLSKEEFEGYTAEGVYTLMAADLEKNGPKFSGARLSEEELKKLLEWLAKNFNLSQDQVSMLSDLDESDEEDMSDEDKSEDDLRWERLLKQSAATAQSYGRLPGGMALYAKLDGEAEVDYKAHLRVIFSACAAKHTPSWMRLSRRLSCLPPGFCMPGHNKQDIGTIVVACDTSGSMVSEEQFNRFMNEIYYLHRQFKPARLIVIDCDAEVHNVWEYGPQDHFPLNTQFTGSGGTAFEPVFAKLEEMMVVPSHLIYLTDCCGSYPEHAPNYPVLWVKYGQYNITPPFGKLVELDL